MRYFFVLFYIEYQHLLADFSETTNFASLMFYTICVFCESNSIQPALECNCIWYGSRSCL